MNQIKRAALVGTLVSAASAIASDQMWVQQKILRGDPLVLSPAMKQLHPILNYDIVSKCFRERAGLRPDEEIVVRYHAESQMVDLSTFDSVSITLPISDLTRGAPNWGTPD